MPTPRSAATENEGPVCIPMRLPSEQLQDAAKLARDMNPVNAPSSEAAAQHALATNIPLSGAIAVLTGKYWKTDGVKLGVGFLDNPPQDLRAKIILHMNAWAKTANVQFTESSSSPEVRISRDRPGYWSYLGTDICLIKPDQPTLNLQGFTMNTPDSEFHRVVRHETGHTLGCPHEHMRKDLIARIDVKKAIDYFQATQGWNEAQTRAQVLTPLDEASLIGTPPDQTSIMCYQLPGSITTDGKPIIGGVDINDTDYAFMAKVYPKRASAQDATISRISGAGLEGAVEVALGNRARIIFRNAPDDRSLTALVEALR